MGFLDGIKQGIKSLLDKTDIDERVGGALNSFKNNVQQSANSFMQRTVPQAQQQASRVRDQAVGDIEDFWNKPPAPVAPVINTARTVANLTRRLPESKVVANYDPKTGGQFKVQGPAADLLQMAKTAGAKKIDDIVSPVRQGATWLDQQLSKGPTPQASMYRVGKGVINKAVVEPAKMSLEGAREFVDPKQTPVALSKKGAKAYGKTLYGAGRVAANALAPEVDAGMYGASALFGLGTNAVIGDKKIPLQQRMEEGASEGIAQAPLLAAVTGLSNPLIEKIIAKIKPGAATGAAKFALQRLASGALNVPEGAAIQESLKPGSEYTPANAGLDFLTGVATGRGGGAVDAARAKAFGGRKTIDPKTLEEVDTLRDYINGVIKGKGTIHPNAITDADSIASKFLSTEEIDRIAAKSKDKGPELYYRNLMDSIAKKVGDYKEQYQGFALGLTNGEKGAAAAEGAAAREAVNAAEQAKNVPTVGEIKNTPNAQKVTPDELSGMFKQEVPPVKPPGTSEVPLTGPKTGTALDSLVTGPQMGAKPTNLDDLLTGPAPQRELPRSPQTLNAERLGLDEEGKNVIAALENDGKPRTTLKNADVAAMAENVNPRVNPVTEEQTAAKIAKNVATRSQAASDEVAFHEAKAAGATPEELKALLSKTAESSQVARSVGTDAGRTLQAQKIIAEANKTPMQKIFGLLDNAGISKDKYLNDAVGVNWDDANSVTEFYRKHVPAKFGDWIDTLRYNSMLSSPNTHINNAFGNAMGSGLVAPIEKTITGGIDFLHSAVTGGPRKYSMGEGPAYAKGYWSNVGNAALKFADTMSGKNAATNVDMVDNLPLSAGQKGLKGFVAKNLEYPMKLLEASDQFFSTLVEGGSKAALEHRASRGIKLNGDIDAMASKEAAYRLFRQDIKDPGQGHVLDAIDSVTQLINQARQNKNPIVSTIAKFTLPFVKTPMNILKQGIEYSPAGITTLLGASNKTEQLSKAIFGTAVFTGAATMLGSGRLTWAAPTNKKEKDAFYASGMQPYAIKVGNNWVQYTKLPPSISFPMAMVAAIDDGLKTKKITQSTADAILSGISKYGNFFADQSYLKSIGDLVASVKGDPYAISSTIANYPQQFVPWRAMGGWMARLTDPNQRAVNTDAGYIEQQVQQLMMNIPGLSQAVPARTDLSGAPVENQNRVLNAFSPLKTTTERPDQKMIFDTMQEENKAASDQKILDKQAETNLDSIFGKGPSSEKEYKITGFGGGKVAGAEASNMPQLDDPKMKALASYYKLDEVNAMPEDTAFNKAKKQKAIFDTVDEVMKSKKMSDQEQSQFLAAATGLPPEKIDYYRVAKTTEDERYGFAVDTLTNLGKDSDPFQALTEMRQEVDGKMILTAGVIDSLVDDGLISLADGKALKKVKAAKGGGVTTSGGGGGGGGSKATKADQKALSALFDNKPKAQSYAFSKSITGLSNSKKAGKPSSSSIESILSKKRKTALSVKPPK